MALWVTFFFPPGDATDHCKKGDKFSLYTGARCKTPRVGGNLYPVAIHLPHLLCKSLLPGKGIPR